jgi:hypothetical protein
VRFTRDDRIQGASDRGDERRAELSGTWLGCVRCVDEWRDFVEEAQDLIRVGRWRVKGRPGDAHLAQLVQRAMVGFGALDGDGDVDVATCRPCCVLKLPDPRPELLHGHAGVRHPFVTVGEDAADDAFVGAADEDGWVWSLLGLGPGPDGPKST